MTHFLVRCPSCKRVISQCRCPGPKTERVAPEPCSECRDGFFSEPMYVLAVKNRDKAELKAIFDRNGIRWKEHGADLSGRNPQTGAIVDPDDPELVAYVEIFVGEVP